MCTVQFVVANVQTTLMGFVLPDDAADNAFTFGIWKES